MSNNGENKIKLLSFFTGGGFLDLGFELSGFETVWSNEYEKSFAELFHHGMTSWAKSINSEKIYKITNTKSITEIDSDTIVKEAFPNKIPEVFGIIGGPPCQDFSINGTKNGFDGERGKLTRVYVEKILEINPTFFLMENVPGLIGLKKAKPIFKELIELLNKKYFINIKKLNSINYGVPQSRERIFVIGFSKQIIGDKLVKFDWPLNKKYKNALKKYEWPKTNVFGSELQKPKNIPNELCVESCLKKENENIENIDEYFKFKNSKINKLEILEGETNRPSFKRLHRYRYSPTTSYGNNEVHLHPYEDRRLSLREALRIQGVPDSYILPKEISLSKKFKIVGNGVPVPLSAAVAEAIKSFLIDYKII